MSGYHLEVKSYTPLTTTENTIKELTKCFCGLKHSKAIWNVLDFLTVYLGLEELAVYSPRAKLEEAVLLGWSLSCYLLTGSLQFCQQVAPIAGHSLRHGSHTAAPGPRQPRPRRSHPRNKTEETLRIGHGTQAPKTRSQSFIYNPFTLHTEHGIAQNPG